MADANPIGPTSFQQTCTASAAALPNVQYFYGVVIKALTANTGTVYVGGAGVTSANGFPLTAGESISYAATNANLIYIVGSDTTQVVSGTGS
jgi:hypothetical protein